MVEGNWSVVRVEKISAEGAQKTERHNERKNESYANLNVDTEQIARNVHFKDTGGLTYNEYFQRLIDEGKISTRGQKAGATIFNELVIDVNTRYFEEHGGYEYAKPYILHRNGASPIVMRDVQKCTGAGAALRDRNVQPLCCINLDTATDPSCCQDQFFILSHKGVQPGRDPLDPALHVGVEQCVLQGGLGSGHIVIDITDGGQIPVGSWDDVMAVCLLKDHICHCQFFCLISSLIRYLATSRSRRSCRSRR